MNAPFNALHPEVPATPASKNVPAEAGAPVGRILKSRREAAGLSQRALAKAAGCDNSVISRAETGENVPDVDVLRRLAAALATTVGALLGEAPATVAGLPRAPFHRIRPNPLNPRKTFNEATLRELADSIAEVGLLEPIGLAPRPGGDYLLIFGERRWRALGILMKENRWPVEHLPDDAVPYAPRPLGADDEQLAEAVIENIQREDVLPLEEAAGFKLLIDLNPARWNTKTLAARVRKTVRYVQLRLELVTKLAEPVKQALAAGEITVTEARAFTAGDKKAQAALLKRVGQYGLDARDIRDHLVDDKPPVKLALFDRALYTGEIVEDPEERGDERFADAAQFARLQESAIKALKAKLEGVWAWVRIERSQWFATHAYGRSKDKKKAGAIIHVQPDLEVKVYDGLVERAAEKPPAKKTAKGGACESKAPPVTNAGLAAAHNAKTGALQRAVAADPRYARIMLCLALLGVAENVHICPICGPTQDPADGIVDKQVATAIERLGFGGEDDDPRAVDDDWPDDDDPDVGRGLALYRKLRALSAGELDALFAALVARYVGTFSGYHPRLGDSAVAVELAKDLGVTDLPAWTVDDDYLKNCRRPHVAKLLKAAGEAQVLDQLAERPAKELRQRVLAEAPTILPPELQFGTAKELEKAKPLLRPGGPQPSVPRKQAASNDAAGRPGGPAPAAPKPAAKAKPTRPAKPKRRSGKKGRK